MPSLPCHALTEGVLSLCFGSKRSCITCFLCQAFLCPKDNHLGVHLIKPHETACIAHSHLVAIALPVLSETGAAAIGTAFKARARHWLELSAAHKVPDSTAHAVLGLSL